VSKKKKGGAAGVVGALLLTLIVLVAAVAGGGYFYTRHVYTQAGPATPDGLPRLVTIAPGSGTPAIAAALAGAGAITDANQFRLAVRVTDTGPRLKAGEYEIESGASLKAIIDKLVAGRSVLHPVTIPEGLTSAVIVKMIAAAPVLGGPPPDSIPAEGVLLPDTYMVQRGETQQQMISRMIEAQRKLMEELWPNRQAGLPFETQEEALILASIVEKEASVAEERPMVASVFVNRLRKGMRLETDPTIIYGVCLQRPDSCVDAKLVNEQGQRRPIRRSEIALDTGYNTYVIPGLPPTPISNPGRASIEAVLNPPVSDALFFVADGTGGHAFASSYTEHLQNVNKWRAIEDGRLAAEEAARSGNPGK
jgi:UPF0755 protein